MAVHEGTDAEGVVWPYTRSCPVWDCDVVSLSMGSQRLVLALAAHLSAAHYVERALEEAQLAVDDPARRIRVTQRVVPEVEVVPDTGLAVPQLRCPGCGQHGFVRELEGTTKLTEWLFDCGACVRRFKVEFVGTLPKREGAGHGTS